MHSRRTLLRTALPTLPLLRVVVPHAESRATPPPRDDVIADMAGTAGAWAKG